MAKPTTSDDSTPVIFAVATAPEFRAVERSGVTAFGAKLIQTGIGPTQVRSMVEAMMDARPGGLISIGTAGALAPDLAPGRLLLPTHVMTEDGEEFRVDPTWHSIVCGKLEDSHADTGAILSVTRPVRSPRDKRMLRARSGAGGVDMESAELARAAAHYAIPFLVVRAIVDPHDLELPVSALAALTSRGDTHIAGLLTQLLRRPADIAGLLRLSRCFRAAARTLVAGCRSAGEQMCNPNPSPLL